MNYITYRGYALDIVQVPDGRRSLETDQVSDGFSVRAYSRDEEFFSGCKSTLEEALDSIKTEIDAKYDEPVANLEPRAVSFDPGYEVYEPYMDETYG